MEPHHTLNPGHGPAAPLDAPPPRTPGSVRRTTTIDIIRAEGFSPGLVLLGRGRDLWTREHDEAVLGTSSFDAEIDHPGSRHICSIRTRPVLPAISRLIDVDAMSGFRRRLGDIMPGTQRTLLLHLLDDIPGTTPISGHAHMAARDEPRVQSLPILMQRNVCAGWRDGGTFARSIDDGDILTVRGPLAPDGHSAGPLAWHELPPATPTMMRRHRLLDVSTYDGGWLTRISATVSGPGAAQPPARKP